MPDTPSAPSIRGMLSRRTKVVATVGPATRSPEMIRRMIESGVNVFRLNFSHGTHEEHLHVLDNIREISEEIKVPVAILQDLSGPKLRISDIEEDYVTINDHARIDLHPSDGSYSTEQKIYVQSVDPTRVLKPGHRVLLADGLIELSTVKVNKSSVECEIIKGGRIRSRVGIAFPDSEIDLPATTEKDLKDLEWGIENQVDYVAISFVKNAEDILSLREALDKKGKSVRIVAKIERKIALENIHEILDASDGLMVARGDLGLELPMEQLPLIQKHLIEEANFRGIPVIVATQMLHSMITSVRPTRAEVSDIAAAVMSGTDAVMLSEETAIGENPIEAVEYLGRIAHEAERTFAFEEYKLRLRGADSNTVPDAVAYAAAAAANKVRAPALVACTETGASARLIAKYRPQQLLFGASTNPDTLRRMCLFWGVVPVYIDSSSSHEDELEGALRAVQNYGKFENGTRAIITGGLSVRTPGSTSVMEIREMKYN